MYFLYRQAVSIPVFSFVWRDKFRSFFLETRPYGFRVYLHTESFVQTDDTRP